MVTRIDVLGTLGASVQMSLLDEVRKSFYERMH